MLWTTEILILTTKREAIEMETRHVQLTSECIKGVNPDDSVDIVASEAKRDKFNEVILQNWDLAGYKKNPVIMQNHDYKISSVIGVCSKVGVINNQLRATIHYFSETEGGRTALNLNKKRIGMWSVGFQGLEVSTGADIDSDPDIPDEFKHLDPPLDAVWKKVLLLEISSVAIGALDSALMTSVSTGDILNLINNQRVEIRSFANKYGIDLPASSDSPSSIEPSGNIENLIKQINDSLDKTDRALKGNTSKELKDTICSTYTPENPVCNNYIKDVFGNL